jgi:hypothetical protein
MKRIYNLLAALAILAATAQPARAQDSLESQISADLSKASSRFSTGTKLNEIVRGNVTYSGIIVQVIKTDNLLQLVNPLAPAKYGSGNDNVMRGPATGGAAAWTLFSIRF